MSVPFSAKVRVPDDVLLSELDGESVLLKLKSESYFGLDVVGTRMWELLLASDSVDAAFQALLNEFDVSADQLRADMSALLDRLVEQGLLEVATASPQAR
jgi:hypothetical protein